MKPLLAALLAAVVAGCAAGNTGAKIGLRLDHLRVSTPPIAIPSAVTLPPPCPADLLADLLTEPAPEGGFPAPETAAASASVRDYFGWLHRYAAWGRQGWARAAEARTYCKGTP